MTTPGLYTGALKQSVMLFGVDANGNQQPIATDSSGRIGVVSSNGVMSTVSVGTSSAQVLAAVAAGRRRLTFQNTGTGTITLYFGMGNAVAGQGLMLAAGVIYNEPSQDCWSGAVQAIASATSNLTIIAG